MLGMKKQYDLLFYPYVSTYSVLIFIQHHLQSRQSIIMYGHNRILFVVPM